MGLDFLFLPLPNLILPFTPRVAQVLNPRNHQRKLSLSHSHIQSISKCSWFCSQTNSQIRFSLHIHSYHSTPRFHVLPYKTWFTMSLLLKKEEWSIIFCNPLQSHVLLPWHSLTLFQQCECCCSMGTLSTLLPPVSSSTLLEEFTFSSFKILLQRPSLLKTLSKSALPVTAWQDLWYIYVSVGVLYLP